MDSSDTYVQSHNLTHSILAKNYLHIQVCLISSGTPVKIVYARVTTPWVPYSYSTRLVNFYNLPGCWYVLSPTRKETSSEACRDARDFNNTEMRVRIKFFFFLYGKAPKEIHAILTETLACFPPGRTKDFSGPLYLQIPSARNFYQDAKSQNMQQTTPGS